MKKVRTHLEDRVLPSYTKGEEIFNMVSHIAGGALAIAALVLCVIFAVIHTDAWGVVGAAIYGSTMVVLYAMSSIYHGLKPEMPKKVFQVIDHCTIYFLIAGTYTPVTLTALRPQYPVQAFVIFGFLYLGYDFVTAAGNAKALNFASGVGALVSFAVSGTIIWSYGLIMAAAMIAGAVVGTRLAIKKGASYVRPLYLLVTTLLIGKQVYDILLK